MYIHIYTSIHALISNEYNSSAYLVYHFRIRQLSIKINTCFLTVMCLMQSLCIQQLRNNSQQTFVTAVNPILILHHSSQYPFGLCMSGGIWIQVTLFADTDKS